MPFTRENPPDPKTVKIMKKILCLSLLLTGLAQAAPYTSQADHFTADFPGPVTTRVEKEMHAYGYGGPRIISGVLVFHGKERLSRYDTLKKIKADANIKFTTREITQGLTPGLEFQGLDEHGVPTFGRVFTTKQSSYVIVSSNFDTAASRKFVESFHLTEASPQKAAKKKGSR